MTGHRLPLRRRAQRGIFRLLLASALLASGVRHSSVQAGEPPTHREEVSPASKQLPSQKNFFPLAATAPAAGREYQAVPSAPPPPKESSGEEWFMEWRYAVNHTRLKGNKERSFLHEGVNHQVEYTLLSKRTLLESRKFEGLGVFRYTDDPRVDPEINSLQRGYLRWSGPTFEANFGDYLTSYSRFSLSQNTKGLNAWKRLPVGGGLRLVGTTGLFTDRWGSIFRRFEKFADPRTAPDPRFPSKPYTRLVLGARAEQRLGENSFVGLNYSQGSDIIRSLPREAQVRPFNNQVVSFDASLRLGRDFTLAGEFAYSLTQFDARLQPDKRNDYAARFEAAQRWKRLSWRVDYARFMPNFFSVNARQVQDLQDASARVSVDLARNVGLTASLRHTNDNLPGGPVVVLDPSTSMLEALTNDRRFRGDKCVFPLIPDPTCLFSSIRDANGTKVTTTTRSPEIRLQFRRLPPNNGLQVSAGYRERQFETSNKTSFNPMTGAALFQDRVTKIPFLDLELSARSSLLGFSYEYRHNRDRVKRSNSTFTHRFVATYRGTYYWGAWVVTPGLRFETEPERRQILRVEAPVQDMLFAPLALAITGHDQTRSLQGSLTLDFPRYFSLEVLYRELNAELLSSFTRDRLDPVTGLTVLDPVSRQPIRERLFGNGGYNRPYARAALTYKIRNSEDRFVVVSFERSVNTFLQADRATPDQRSFRENVLQVAFVLRWRR